ncbi:MAG: hypothetical protein R3310_11815 [Candidatus Competibacteraceae bacterium]|nr:hypothetical protein [Candidatus Competibacteraceae bacterium]
MENDEQQIVQIIADLGSAKTLRTLRQELEQMETGSGAALAGLF